MADVKVVLEWANSVCEQALTEAKTGNTALVNRVGSNSAMKMFMDNVHGLKSIPANNFPAYYAMQWKEIERLYEAYVRDEQVSETVDKVAVLEGKMDTLTELVKQLVENQQVQTETAPAEDPAPKGKKQAKKDADDSEDTPAEGDTTPEPEA